MAIAAALLGLFGFYFASSTGGSQEVTYVDFLHKYLATNRCKMITISEDKQSDMFKFRA